FLEGATEGHHLAHRFHLDGKFVLDALEFFEVPARYLCHNIVDSWLETRRCFFRDVVRYLVQRVPDGEFRGNLGDRKARSLGRQRRTARYAWVHFDDDEATVVGIDGELDIGAARLHPDLADDPDGRVPHV